MNIYDLNKEIKINWKEKKNKQLVSALLSLKTPDETARFLRDLMTESEIKEFGNRLEAARCLSRDVYYDAISQETGLSSATIARIKKWLLGPLGGYRTVLARLSNHHHNPAKLGKGLYLS